MVQSRVLASLPCVLALAACAARADGPDLGSAGARFEPLAALPGALVNAALGISGDGRVIVGYCRSPVSSHARGAAWVRSDDPAYVFGLPVLLEGEGLPFLQPDTTLDPIRSAIALAVGPFSPVHRLLADVPRFTLGYAADADWGDASAVLKTSLLRSGSALGVFDPSWPGGHGAFGVPAGFDAAAPAAVSLAGETLAGVARRAGVDGEPFTVLQAGVFAGGVWREIAWLDGDPACRQSFAHGVSADGTVVVGRALMFDGSSKTPLFHAFAWTAAAGTVDLGSLALGVPSAANDATADGRIVVGWSGEGGPDGAANIAGRSATVWFPGDRHPRLLSDVLRDDGAYLGAWTLSEATGISDDGTTVIGIGLDPQGVPGGWVATLLPRVWLDFNRDGLVSCDDLSDYMTAYFTLPPVSGPGGFAVPCSGDPSGAAPLQGYQAQFSSGCQPPTPDDLGDFLTSYYLAYGG